MSDATPGPGHAQGGWAGLPEELLHLSLSHGVPTSDMAWRAALRAPGAAWASLELALRVDGTEASLQASLPRLRAIGANTTSLGFSCGAASRYITHRPARSDEQRRKEKKSSALRQLAEHALVLVVPALPRLRTCRALDLPLGGPSLGPLLQHPALRELQMGLDAANLEVSPRPLQRLDRASCSHLTSLTIRLSGSPDYDKGDRLAELLADLTAFSRVPCLHFEVCTDLFNGRDEFLHGPEMPEELAALTNLHSLTLEIAADRHLPWHAHPTLSALIHLSRVDMVCYAWGVVAPGLAALPVLRRLRLVVAAGEGVPSAESMQFLSRLEHLDLALVHNVMKVQPSSNPSGALVEGSSWRQAFARRPAAEDQLGVRMPRLRNLQLLCSAKQACCFSWGSLTALTSLYLKSATGREDICLPDYSYLETLVELEVIVKSVLPAQLSRAVRLESLCVEAESRNVWSLATAELLDRLPNLQRIIFL